MSALYMWDDDVARAFEPFALTRPVSELLAGAEVIRHRWERIVGVKAAGFIGAAHLARFDEAGAPRCLHGDQVIPAGSVIANSRFVPAIAPAADWAGADNPDASDILGGDRVCAVRTKESVRVSDISDGLFRVPVHPTPTSSPDVPGRWLDAVWDLVAQLEDQLAEDIPRLAATLASAGTGDAVILGEFPVHCEEGARIEPFVVLDATSGPILIRNGAKISSFSRIVGPCYIGVDASVVSDAVRGCSIGDVCKVRGEISNSVMAGYSNKGHTGFVGHSYLGRWVNLGAGTTTSNLKNTYGTVQMWTPSGMRDTGAQFLGTMFGDHVKTGIGTMLTTGTIVGAGANIYGSGPVPKYVHPFAWGDGEPYRRYGIEKFIATAGRMMERRHVELSADAGAQLAAAHAMTSEDAT